MVTNADDDFRNKMRPVAIRSFLDQTYKRRKLIIINHGKRTLYSDSVHLPSGEQYTGGRISLGVSEPVVEFRVEKATLGAMRNIGLDQAASDQKDYWPELKLSPADLVVSWDDDDWSHPDRLVHQVAMCSDGNASSLPGYVVLNLNSTQAWVRSMKGFDNRCAAGLMMFPIADGYLYPEKDRHEDSSMCKKYLMAKRLQVSDNHHLYVRTGHPGNTSGMAHVLTRWPNDRALSPDGWVQSGPGIRNLLEACRGART